MLRYLNMFVLIGVALVAISLAGFATSNRFLTEPGQPPSANASFVYLGAGILMLINGIVSVRTASVAQPPASKSAPSADAPVENKSTVAETVRQ